MIDIVHYQYMNDAIDVNGDSSGTNAQFAPWFEAGLLPRAPVFHTLGIITGLYDPKECLYNPEKGAFNMDTGTKTPRELAALFYNPDFVPPPSIYGRYIPVNNVRLSGYNFNGGGFTVVDTGESLVEYSDEYNDMDIALYATNPQTYDFGELNRFYWSAQIRRIRLSAFATALVNDQIYLICDLNFIPSKLVAILGDSVFPMVRSGYYLSVSQGWQATLDMATFKAMSGQKLFIEGTSAYDGKMVRRRVWLTPVSKPVIDTKTSGRWKVTLRTSDSYDVDGTIVSRQIKIGTQNFGIQTIAPQFVEQCIERDENDTFTIDLDALRKELPLLAPTLTSGGTLTITLRLTDNDGLWDETTVSYPIPARKLRSRAVVRPGGKLWFRQGYILWVDSESGDLWAGEPRTGNVLLSNDEGATWTIMSNAWKDVEGAEPFDFEYLPGGGACSIARVSGQIIFRLSHDNIEWEETVPICPAGTVESWCVRAHTPIGSSTISISDMTSVQYDTEALGEKDSWEKVSLS